MPGTRPGMTGVMSELALTIRAETPDDDAAIERLHERTFGPGRYARTAFRIREGRRHLLPVSFTARIGTLLVGSVRLTPVRIGATPALLLGPLTVEPAAVSKVQPSRPMSGETTDSDMTFSSAFSLRKMMVRCAHGQASET